MILPLQEEERREKDLINKFEKVVGTVIKNQPLGNRIESNRIE